MWAPPLLPDPRKKGLVPHFPVWWDVQQILSVSVQSQSQRSLREPLPRAVIFLIVKLRGFSLLSFVYVSFAFNIFLITYFCVVSSFGPPLDHNKENILLIYTRINDLTKGIDKLNKIEPSTDFTDDLKTKNILTILDRLQINNNLNSS